MHNKTKKFIDRCKRLEVLSTFLTSESFTYLLNAGACIIQLNLPQNVSGGILYKQLANYQGISIETTTENKIYEI